MDDSVLMQGDAATWAHYAEASQATPSNALSVKDRYGGTLVVTWSQGMHILLHSWNKWDTLDQMEYCTRWDIPSISILKRLTDLGSGPFFQFFAFFNHSLSDGDFYAKFL